MGDMGRGMGRGGGSNAGADAVSDQSAGAREGDISIQLAFSSPRGGASKPTATESSSPPGSSPSSTSSPPSPPGDIEAGRRRAGVSASAFRRSPRRVPAMASSSMSMSINQAGTAGQWASNSLPDPDADATFTSSAISSPPRALRTADSNPPKTDRTHRTRRVTPTDVSDGHS